MRYFVVDADANVLGNRYGYEGLPFTIYMASTFANAVAVENAQTGKFAFLSDIHTWH